MESESKPRVRGSSHYINLNVKSEPGRVTKAVLDLLAENERRRPTVPRMEMVRLLATKMNEDERT